MIKIYIPVDNKSLFYNIFNDNKTGHTSSVSTPIKQGKSYNAEVAQIFNIPKQIDLNLDFGLNDYLNKSSKSTTKITNVFIFDKLSVNSIKVNCEDSFCIYVKEEIDPSKLQCGRIKLHYPISISYGNYFEFDNKKVLTAISKTLNDYAFVLKGFYYDFDTEYLDFDVDIVGYNNIPYSKVYKKYKGVGNKYSDYFYDYTDNYDIESLALKKVFGYDTDKIENYFITIENQKKEAFILIKEYLISIGAKKIIDMDELYPYGLYNFSYYLNNVKRYAIVSFSGSNEVYFNLTIKLYNFIKTFNEYVDLFSVTDIYNNKRISKFNFEDLEDFIMDITGFMFKKEV